MDGNRARGLQCRQAYPIASICSLLSITDASQFPRQSSICELIQLECEKLPNTRLERTENLFERQSPIGGASHDSFRIERRPMCPYRADGSLVPMPLGGVGI